jgi:ubiquinol-cytochrome c reductase cytochrome c subunit
MDVFSNGNLSPEEKRDVIAYVQSMREQPGYGGFSLGSMGPVSEGMFAWLVGLGTCVAFAVWIAAHTTRSSKKKKESQA